MNKFERISREQYEIDRLDDYCELGEIKLPTRATINAAGYDFYSPLDFYLDVGETIKIFTGVKMSLDENLFLAVVPRSGHGFKYRIQLDNTLGIIDQDFYNNITDEGHIKVKITNDGKEGKVLHVKQGEAFCQGIILQYFKTDNDVLGKERIGGLGST